MAILGDGSLGEATTVYPSTLLSRSARALCHANSARVGTPPAAGDTGCTDTSAALAGSPFGVVWLASIQLILTLPAIRSACSRVMISSGRPIRKRRSSETLTGDVAAAISRGVSDSGPLRMTGCHLALGEAR